jgi:hypothetical protein
MKKNRLVIKDWIEKADWKMWLVMGVVIVFSMTAIRHAVIDHGINKKRQQIMEAIDRQENVMQEGREMAEKRGQEVDADLGRAEQAGQAVISSAEKNMDNTQREMSQEK